MKIPYSLSNFEKIISENYYYVDRTNYIEILENFNEEYLLFLRPRRFGKSLFCSMLTYYYDIQYSENFNKLFGNTYIGKHPTPQKNSYLVLKFDFSGISTDSPDLTLKSFANEVRTNIRIILYKYNSLNKDIENELKENETPADLLKIFFAAVKSKLLNNYGKVFIIIDEYDHFANELLAFKPKDFNNMFGSSGFVRKFYENIKKGTMDGVVDRVFITGVTPIALDNLSSGFNIAANVSNRIAINEMTGFTANEVKEIVSEMIKCCNKKDPEKLYLDLKIYYDGYLFNANAEQRIFNPNMVFYFAGRYTEGLRGEYPKNLIDHNIISDYTKIQQMFNIGDLKDNLTVLDDLLFNGFLTAGLIENDLTLLFKRDQFVSLLYYLGIISIKDDMGDMLRFVIPNYVIERLYLEFFLRLLEEHEEIDLQTTELYTAIYNMSQKGDVKPLADMIEKLLGMISNRDSLGFDEKHIKLAIYSYLSLTKMYFVKSEYEVNRKYLDLVMLQRSPFKVNYQYVFELKYLKIKDKGNLNKIYKDAVTQLKNYLKFEELKSMNNLKAYVLVFVGDKCEVCEEIK